LAHFKRASHFRRTVAAGWCVIYSLPADLFALLCLGAAMSFGCAVCHDMVLFVCFCVSIHFTMCSLRACALMLITFVIISMPRAACAINYLFKPSLCACVSAQPICPHECILLHLQIFPAANKLQKLMSANFDRRKITLQKVATMYCGQSINRC
jgi:hypothetical protein